MGNKKRKSPKEKQEKDKHKRKAAKRKQRDEKRAARRAKKRKKKTKPRGNGGNESDLEATDDTLSRNTLPTTTYQPLGIIILFTIIVCLK